MTDTDIDSQLRLDEIQTHYCQTCGQWLDFCFDRYTVTIDGVEVRISNMPLLRCNQCHVYYFPHKTKLAIKAFVQGAKEQEASVGNLALKKDFSRKFGFGKVDFVYSHIDHDFIPGLWRPRNTGFLTPVFFNLAVLNKYAQHPDYRLDLFSRTYGTIEKKSEFHIDFGINRNGKVIMWLGDIDKLPEGEQHYLRSENVESDHDLYSEFYESQIEVKFSELSPENALIHSRAKVHDLCNSKRGNYLHILEGEISRVIANLNRPVFWTEKHVGPVIESYNRIIVESLNNPFLKQELSSVLNQDELKGLKSLKLLEKWAEKVLHIQNAGDWASPFYVLYDFRVLTSHLIPDEKKEETLKFINQRLGLDINNTNLEVIYDAFLTRLIKSYEVLREALK